jgi:putative methionine-R-sulfoxide reductase with GAF domain
VLDLDSPLVDRFHAADARLLEALVTKLVAACDWNLAGIDGY